MQKIKVKYNDIDKYNRVNGINPLKRNAQLIYSWGNYAECEQIFIGAMKHADNSIKEVVIDREHKEIIEWMTDTKGKGLALIGDSGRGKTLFLHGVLPYLLSAAEKVPRMIKAYQLKECIGYGLVLIDELGREPTAVYKNYEKIDAFPIHVDSCVDSSKPLFFTTNLGKSEFIKRYGGYIFNRIKKNCKIIIFKGDSLW